MKVPVSSEAVNVFVKFLYGFDIDESVGEETLKELIQIGGVYDSSVQDAAADLLKKHLTKENIFELYKFSKQNDSKTAMKHCQELILKEYTYPQLLDNGHLEEHPETAVEILKQNRKPKKLNNLNPIDTISLDRNSCFFYSGIKFVKCTEYGYKIKFTTLDPSLIVTGVGLFISHSNRPYKKPFSTNLNRGDSANMIPDLYFQ